MLAPIRLSVQIHSSQLVPAVAVNVPLFVIVPEICNVLPVTVSDDPIVDY